MRFIAFVFIFLGSSVYAAHYKVKLGNETVIIQQIQNGPGKAFIHVHQNETTAFEAAKMVVQEKGGSLITLRHTGGRNISFHLHGKRYEFDPNRIFTDQGIKNTLTQFGPYSREAHQVVKRLANKIISLLPPGKIIAVHNNRSYSLKDYLPGHSYAGEAESIHFHDKAHYRNFYLVTRKQDFNRLKKLNFNEILQSPQPEDDGSLSVYLANRAYINVEAGFDQLKAQIKMLKCA